MKHTISILLILFALMGTATAETSDGCFDGSNGAVAHWTMNTTAMIEVCNGNDGTNTGATAVAGQFNNSLDYEETESDFGTAPHSALYDFDWNENFTMCLWGKPESAPIGVQQALFQKNNPRYWGSLSFKNNNTILFIRYDVANTGRIYSTATYSTGVWTHICGAVDTGLDKMLLWLNGSMDSNATDPLTQATTSNTAITIGKWAGGATLYMDGLIDEIFIFNYTLNDTEVNNLYTYNNVTGLAAPPPTVIGCSITVNDYNITNGSVGSTAWTPQNGSASAPLVATYTPTCYQADNYICTLIREGTHVGDNTTTITNASVNYINTNATWSDTAYQTNITCTNGTYTNSSTNTTLNIDTTPPTINMTYPMNLTYANGTAITLNFTFSENNPNFCRYSFNGAANVTIAYVNDTAITSTIGVHSLELWCFDNALNQDHQRADFIIQGATVMAFDEYTPHLATEGMWREFRSYYTPLGASNVTGDYAPADGSHKITSSATVGSRWFQSEVNATHYVDKQIRGGGASGFIKLRWKENGTLVKSCTVEGGIGDNYPFGIYCTSDTTCYHGYFDSDLGGTYLRHYIRRMNPTNCTQTLVTTIEHATYGFSITGGMVFAGGYWWVGTNPTQGSLSITNITRFSSAWAAPTVMQPTPSANARYFAGDLPGYFLTKTDGKQVFIHDSATGANISNLTIRMTLGDTIGPNRDLFMDGNRIYSINEAALNTRNFYWGLNITTTVPNATCNFTYNNYTANMTDTGPYHAITIIENNSDHETNIATSTCTASAYETKDASKQVETNNWHRPIGATQDIPFTVLADYTDVSDFHVQRFGNLDGILHCVRINTEGNSLEIADDLDLWVYQEAHLASYGANDLELTLREKTSGKPGNAVATCNLTLPGITFEEQWFNCTANPTETITINTDYFVCSNQTYMGVTVGTTDTSHEYVNGTWSVSSAGNALSVVTENTDEAVLPNRTDNFIEGIVWDCADPTRRLDGIYINVTQQNESGQPNIKSDITDANGIFSMDDLWLDIPAQITYADPTNEYESITGAFTLTQTYPSRNLSTCLGLPVAPVGIKTAWKMYNNVTDAFETIETFTQWRPNETYKKDTLLLTIKAFVENENGDPQTGMDFTSSTVTTDCSYSTPPTTYYITEEGNGFYNLVALIGATNETNLYAYCAEGDSFELTYRASGIIQKTRVDFQAFQMRITGATLLVDQLTAYNWAFATALFYYNKADQMNKPVSTENLQCQARLENSSGSNFTAWTNMNTTANKVTGNFTTLAQTPTIAYIRWNCTASGFDRFEDRTLVSIGTDAVTSIDCWIQDTLGNRLEWTTIGEQLQHFCQLQTHANASLRNLLVKSTNANLDRERIFSYSSDSANLWTFATPLLADDMPKGLHAWSLEYTNTPTGLSMPDFTYYQFTKVYSSPPKKISPDYCNGENCPKTLWKGDGYKCQVITEFETEYTKIIAGIKLNHSTTLITVPHSDVFNTETGIHATSIFINGIGETGQYGILDDTIIQCHFELYIDNERLVYGAIPTDMNTHFKSEYVNDMLGLSGFINSWFASSDPMGFAFNALTGLPGQAVGRMGVFDETCMAAQGSTDPIGCLRPLIALLYLIAFALLLVVGFVVTAQVMERRRR